MRVRWTPLAFAKLQAIAAHIARDNPAAAVAFAREVRDRAQRLEVFPYMGRAGRDPDTRELIVHRNYLITYSVSAEQVTAFQIWHMAQERY
jgi:addiction module RelE/StbE family toxin